MNGLKVKGLESFIILVLGFLSIFFFIGTVKAANFCVSDAAGLQSALTTVANNGEDDEIQIVQGTYVGNFVYGSQEVYNLTIEGGYTSGCASREVGPSNTILDGNSAGTVLVMSASLAVDFLIDGLTIQNGLTNSNGGGLYMYASDGDINAINGNVTLTNNTISNNTADSDGGGVYVYVGGGTATLTNNTISNNTASSDGGGVYVVDFPDAVTLTNNTISNNTANGWGGGAYLYASTATVILTNNTIRGNTANNDGGFGTGNGGGVYVFGHSDWGTVRLTNNTISNNATNGDGGGVFVDHGIVSFTNNTISNNIATNGGGILLICDEDSETAGIYNNIIWGNSATQGSDLYIDNDSNNNYVPSLVKLFNNDFDQSANGIYIKIPFSIDPTNLDNLDPLFVDANNGDYHLQANSPCIDVGDNNAPELPETDMDGNMRVFDGDDDGTAVVDMGAYEYGSNLSLLEPVPDIKANGSDGTVNINTGDNLLITVELDTGDRTGENADWWVYATSPFGTYWYTLSGWQPSNTPIRVYGGQLFNLPPYTVLNMSTLPVGDYGFNFEVDDNMDGIKDGTYKDSVQITIN